MYNYGFPNIGPVIPKDVQRELDNVYQRRKKAEEAQIKMAEDMEEIQKQNRKIMETLENIFSSSEDSTIVQKEILKTMQDNNINEELLKDKGLDVFVQGILACIGIVLKQYGIQV